MNRISEYRNKIGASQSMLAKEAGLNTSSAISNYESKIRRPSIETGHKIVRALNKLGANCKFSDVFPDPESNNNSPSQSA